MYLRVYLRTFKVQYRTQSNMNLKKTARKKAVKENTMLVFFYFCKWIKPLCCDATPGMYGIHRHLPHYTREAWWRAGQQMLWVLVLKAYSIETLKSTRTAFLAETKYHQRKSSTTIHSVTLHQKLLLNSNSRPGEFQLLLIFFEHLITPSRFLFHKLLQFSLQHVEFSHP